MIDSYTYTGKEEGVSLLVFGAIHGNEVCGPCAVQKIQEDLLSNRLVIKRGLVTFIPVANQKAYEKESRYFEENLNRVFKKTKSPSSYEQELANELTSFVDTHDVLIDIHSARLDTAPFVFLDYPTPDNEALIQAIGIDHVILGWPDLRKNMHDTTVSFDTEKYVHDQGKSGITVECGQHDDPTSCDVAYRVITNGMKHLNIIDGDIEENVHQRRTIMKKLYIRESEEDALVKEWKNFDHVKKGERIGMRGNGKAVQSPFDGYIIFPSPLGRVGDEWFYLGVDA